MFGIFSKQIIMASILISSFVLTACGSSSGAENTPPVAVDDNFSVSEGGTLTISSVIGTLANDRDPENDTLTAILVGSPSFASGFFVLNSDGSFNYTHDGSENQSDSFSYQAFDGELNSNTVTVSISVSAVNEAPVANVDSYSGVSEGGTLTVTSVNGVLVNDGDPENDTLTAILVASPPSFASSFFFNNDGTFSYTHDGTENLNDSFSYQAFDGQLNSNTVTVSITVSAVNDVPVAISSCSTTAQTSAISGTLKATDAESSLLTFSLGSDGSALSGPMNTARGSVIITNSNTGAYTYTPSATGPRGVDSFDYFVEDTDGGFATATETVIVDQKIMPLGDSITRGSDGSSIADNLKVGYRKLLYDSLIAAGYRFDYVGSDASTGAAVANFDSDNEGHSGWTASEIAFGRTATDGIGVWLDDNPTDIILLHIGTNEETGLGPIPGSTEIDTGFILDEIDDWENSSNGNPVTVILAKIVDQNPQNPDVTAYNNALALMASLRATDDIIIVDMETALSYPADLGDAVHPDAGGYAKMAPVWHTGLIPVLDKCP